MAGAVRHFRSPSFAVAVLALVLAATGSPLALSSAHSPAGNVIHACVDTRTGVVRILFQGSRCKPGEAAYKWNEQGPAGPAGVAGPAGKRGAPGATGPAGTIPGNCSSGLAVTGEVNGAVTCGEGTIDYHAASDYGDGETILSDDTAPLVSYTLPDDAGNAFAINAKTDIVINGTSPGVSLEVLCRLQASNAGDDGENAYSVADEAFYRAPVPSDEEGADTTLPLEVTIPNADDPADYPPTITLSCQNDNTGSIAGDEAAAEWNQVDAIATAN